MKIIIPFVATTFLAAMTLAQEESASPAESTAPATEEKASATVEETPASKPAEATAPAAEKKAEPATSPKAAAAAATKKEATTSTAAKPAAPAAAAAPSGKKMSVEAALKDNENRWEASYAAHDVSVAQSLVANDFAGVYWDGKVMSKSGVISEIKKDKDTYKSATNEKLAVHTYGPNVAVIVGTAREKGTGKDGKAFDRTFRFTDTWMLRNGQWQCVASQVMKLKG